MPNNIINVLKTIIKFLINPFKEVKFYFFNKTYNKIMKINHNGYGFYFHIPNWITLYRAETFSSKEPETLEWIDNFDFNSVFWDIGANVGLYSIYAAKTKNTITYSFEPSVFNLEFLAKNIFLNNLQNSIYILPVALADKNGVNIFNMSNTLWGGALSTFSKSHDQNGNDLKINFKYNTLGITADNAFKLFNLSKPKYIKIDVDGIEHLILSGMSNILDSTSEILIEISNNFLEQMEKSTQILKSKGFTLQSPLLNFDKNIPTNQIWKK
jgi:FkbM family methyltransferase